MTTKSNDTRPMAKDEQIARLLCERRNLESHGAELKSELAHMKRALRVTQNRIRGLNKKLELVRQDRPRLRLVVARNIASSTGRKQATLGLVTACQGDDGAD